MKFYKKNNVKNFAIFTVFICLAMVSNANAISAAAKQKYPYTLLTDDYGILSENDLAAFTWGLKPRLFTAEEISGEYKYWQCFPRERISITLKDTGYSSVDVGWDDIADLQIEVVINPYLSHKYDMRARWGVKDYEKRFNLWKKLMKGEQYVCLAGEFSDRKRKMKNGKTKEIYSWTFERIKTKKGCDSYLESCNPTYERYLRARGKVAESLPSRQSKLNDAPNTFVKIKNSNF